MTANKYGIRFLEETEKMRHRTKKAELRLLLVSWKVVAEDLAIDELSKIDSIDPNEPIESTIANVRILIHELKEVLRNAEN